MNEPPSPEHPAARSIDDSDISNLTADTDSWTLADYLAPIDDLLKKLSQIELPDCPDGLCQRTLERCRIDLVHE